MLEVHDAPDEVSGLADQEISDLALQTQVSSSATVYGLTCTKKMEL